MSQRLNFNLTKRRAAALVGELVSVIGGAVLAGGAALLVMFALKSVTPNNLAKLLHESVYWGALLQCQFANVVLILAGTSWMMAARYLRDEKYWVVPLLLLTGLVLASLYSSLLPSPKLLPSLP